MNDLYFDKFWQVWPRKVAKLPAQKAWIKNGCDELLEIIVAAVEKQKRLVWVGKSKDKVPHPATWLNAHRWEDEVEIREDKATVDARRYPKRQEPDPGPEMSGIASWANRVMLKFVRKYGPFGDRMPGLVSAKNNLVADLERFAAEGDAIAEYATEMLLETLFSAGLPDLDAKAETALVMQRQKQYRKAV